jgi:hypothetical protein
MSHVTYFPSPRTFALRSGDEGRLPTSQDWYSKTLYNPEYGSRKTVQLGCWIY